MLKRLQAPLWAWLLMACAVALFAGLGGWQVQRGQAKHHWLAQFGEAGAPATELSAATAAPARGNLLRASARGTWSPERQLLQDGQSRAGRPGYHVWTPLRLADGALVLVNRGWIPQPYDPAAAPLAAPSGEVGVSGWYRALPEPGIRTNRGECRTPAAFPAVVVYPTHEQLRCLLDQQVLPGLLLMDPLLPGGFVREWSAMGIPPARHYGYAVTWFALALTAAILFVLLTRKTP